MSERTERTLPRRRGGAGVTDEDQGKPEAKRTGRSRLLGVGLLAVAVVLIVGGVANVRGSVTAQGSPPAASGGLPVLGDLLREQPVDVEGTVLDARSEQPLPGASVSAAGQSITTDADGRFRVEGLFKDTTLTVSASGYETHSVAVGRGGPLSFPLQPLVSLAMVSDAYTGQPVAGARILAAGRSFTPDAAGKLELVAVPEGAKVVAEADGYARGEGTAHAGISLTLPLRPNVLSGKVTEAGTGKPVPGARIAAGSASATSDAEGKYRLTDLPAEGKLIATAPGYDKVELDLPKATAQDFQLKAVTIRAAYITMAGIGYQPMREKVLDLIDKTELNAIVIDIKDDDGSLAYESQVPLAKAVGALSRTTIPDPEGFIAGLKKRGIYTIARIITFKDTLLSENGAQAGVDVGLKDLRTGRPWKDSSQGLGWVDPFRTEAWDYNIAIAKEAARKGFDEIQFDYIRFPADPAVRYTTFSKENTSENRVAAIAGFLKRAQSELKPMGVYVAADVFGYVSWQQDNVNLPLGQNIEEMAKYVDFISPMNYPSLYWYGLPMTPSYQPAENYPYEIVELSVEKARERIAGTEAKVRTWIQYYNGSNRRYTADDIIAQKKGAIDGGSLGWMLWEPFVEYEKGGLLPE